MRIIMNTADRSKLPIEPHEVQSHAILLGRQDKIVQIELLGSIKALIDRIKTEGGSSKRVIVIEIED